MAFDVSIAIMALCIDMNVEVDIVVVCLYEGYGLHKSSEKRNNCCYIGETVKMQQQQIVYW
jgi:hypothetical protein